MNDRGILVPKEMLNVAIEATKGELEYGGNALTITLSCIKSALRWLSENPIAPTHDDVMAIVKYGLEFSRRYGTNDITGAAVEAMIYEWQRRMFLAPELTVAELDATIPDLLFDSPTHVLVSEANKAIREAFRRGQKAASK